jgi:deazaflavin-dependent oxidoreductase (nitroreductase family)
MTGNATLHVMSTSTAIPEPLPDQIEPVDGPGLAALPSLLPEAPPLSGLAERLSAASRLAFRYGNRALMVPLHRAGLSAWLGNPVTGCQLLLTTRGRKSGLPRHTPLGYCIADGSAWVMAGYGTSTLWYRNLLADPRVEVLLPGRPPLAATAEEVTDEQTRRRIIPALARSMPLPGAMIGCLPTTAPDERILEQTAWVPLIAIRPPSGALIAGPDDPGGHGWIWRQAIATATTLVVAGALRGRRRGRPDEPVGT